MSLKLRVQQIDLTDGTSGQWFARAHIVAYATEDEYEPGTILLSDDCRCASEIVSAADKIIEQLERIKAQARKEKWHGSNAPTDSPSD